ncbi:SDR family NAD(P)-dependent oxidoreductase [Endozoicomonas atrinae]|uniref:SDR family NAD(P)-dependent oxidoreductase n=1 Tax=Endozoicomonas atrinae TaxID=1333660 RepID=UPI000825E747|nr:SDR family oxidoreductase [Endozoicomonas atrinae]
MKIKKGHVAVITGAGGGLGRALAEQLAGRGCHLALIDINPQALEETRAKVQQPGIDVLLFTTDIGNREQMEQMASAVIEKFGTINLLINNAGITIQKSVATHSLTDWERMININLWGTIYGCHFFMDALRTAKHAHIVNLSSMAAYTGLPNQGSYCATKAGVRGLSETLWSELKDDGVGVTSVHPGCIKTEMIQATLKESDNIAVAKRNYKMAQKMGVTADFAANEIIEAVEKNKVRLRIGRDAIILDIVKRLLPTAILKPMVKIARQSRAA